MRIAVEVQRCRGAGLCALTAPEVFDQDEDDGTVVVLVDEPPSDLHESVALAARLCPNSVIRLQET